MKTEMKFLAMMLFAMLTMACSKDDDNNQEPDPQEEGFDINNPEGYFLYSKEAGNSDRIYLFEFLPEEKVQVYTVEQQVILSYAVIDDNTIDIINSGVQFIFDGNNVTVNNNQYDEVVLIKKPESNQLTGKVFGGTRYTSNNPNAGSLYCHFTSNDEVEVDLRDGYTAEDYTAIGNIATKIAVDANNDGTIDETLFMVLVNGKLEANSTRNNSSYGARLFAFDIDPSDHLLYAKASEGNGSNSQFILFDLQQEGGSIPTFTVNFYGPSNLIYQIVAENTIEFADGTHFVFGENTVTSNDDRYKELVLIEKPENNQLAGKTFAGTYFKANGDVLHPNFFYGFHPDEDKVDAGFNIGTVVRTNYYTPIGNTAALLQLQNSDVEFMVLVNGKLEVNYKENGIPNNHYGTFEEQ